ncbi:hypothetical protein BHE74_00045810 [Ensete ventricosum]|nr:hypothetical protein BHE74_00045810 [Ensete ventricosum]
MHVLRTKFQKSLQGIRSLGRRIWSESTFESPADVERSDSDRISSSNEAVVAPRLACESSEQPKTARIPHMITGANQTIDGRRRDRPRKTAINQCFREKDVASEPQQRPRVPLPGVPLFVDSVPVSLDLGMFSKNCTRYFDPTVPVRSSSAMDGPIGFFFFFFVFFFFPLRVG